MLQEQDKLIYHFRILPNKSYCTKISILAFIERSFNLVFLIIPSQILIKSLFVEWDIQKHFRPKEWSEVENVGWSEMSPNGSVGLVASFRHGYWRVTSSVLNAF